jgi:hypothetical protein
MHQVPATTAALSSETVASLAPIQVEHATPLHEISVTLNSVHSELGLLNKGSEIIIIREDIWRKTEAPINQEACMKMKMANRTSQEMAGCIEMLEIDVEGIKTWAHAYVVPNAPYCLLLGRPLQHLVQLLKNEDTKGVYILVHDPMDPTNIQKVSTTPHAWPHPLLALTAAISIIPQQSIPEMTGCTNLSMSAVDTYNEIKSFGSSMIGHTSLPTSTVDTYNAIKSFGSSTIGRTSLPMSVVDIYNVIKSSTSPIPILSSQNPQGRSIFNTNAFPSRNPQERNTFVKISPPSLAIPNQSPTSSLVNTPLANSKKVANKIRPVTTTMLAHAHIVCQFLEDPVLLLSSLSTVPPDFLPGKRLTQE